MQRSVNAPEWVLPFYDRKSREAAPSGLLPLHEERAKAIARFGGVARGRVLELGAGAGGSAVATAMLGYDVTAIELSPTRVQFSRELAVSHGCPHLHVVEADFMSARLSGRFDAVVMLNGFGVGEDTDHRLS